MGKIGTKEAAQRLGVSQGRVVVLINSGRLKAEKIGRTWIIDERSLKTVEERLPGRPPAEPISEEERTAKFNQTLQKTSKANAKLFKKLAE